MVRLRKNRRNCSMTIDDIMNPQVAKPGVTARNMSAALATAAAVAETIRELGEVPEGNLYVAVMAYVDQRGFDLLLGSLTRAGLIERTAGHLVRWIGPI